MHHTVADGHVARISLQAEAQDDLDALFNAALETAVQFLSKRGEFLPFGVRLGIDEQVSVFMADPGLGEQPPSLEVLEDLLTCARSERDQTRVAGLVADVSLQGGGDAVRVEMEHREGTTLEIVVPYRRRRLGGKVTLAEMAVSAGERQIWSE